jgi:hypothetical protein
VVTRMHFSKFQRMIAWAHRLCVPRHVLLVRPGRINHLDAVHFWRYAISVCIDAIA